MRPTGIGASILFLLSAALPPAAPAASIRVMPVRVVLDRSEPIRTLSIRNEGDDAVRVQLRVYAWRQDQGEDAFEPTQDILANPPLFEIPARSAQTVRVGLRTQPAAMEQSFRIFVDEIPPSAAPAPGEVRALLRISIPLFVPPLKSAAHLEWRARMAAGGIAVTLHNAGNAHVQVNQLRIIAADGTVLGTQAMSAYLLPGSTRDMPVRIAGPIAAKRKIVVQAVTDQGNINTALVVEAGTVAGVVG